MELLDRLFTTLFPSRCIVCQQTMALSPESAKIEICSVCLNQLKVNTIYCQRCALPLPDDLTQQSHCGRCLSHPPAFDYARALYHYHEPVTGMIQQLKFSAKLSYARSIGELMAQGFEADQQFRSCPPDCLLPVPLHNSRLRQRGFNQSAEIIRTLASRYGITIEYDTVIRNRSTLAHSGLNAGQRRKNIRGAFRMDGVLLAKHVLIIDDVMTTGSTVNELARVLKAGGVERVGIFCFARAPLKN